MLSVVSFHTVTGELFQCQGVPSPSPDFSVQDFGEVALNKKGMVIADYTITSIPAMATPNQFKQWYYIDGVEVKKKPDMSLVTDKTIITADGVDTATISGIPEGAEVFLNTVSQGYADATGGLELTSTIAKEFNIKCVLYPYLDGEINVTAS